MHRSLTVALLVLSMAAVAQAIPPQSVPWDSARATSEATAFLTDLIRLDTRDPPGNESAVAQYLAGVLTREGIPFELLEPVPGRASIVARLKGDGSRKPLLLMGHEDVVPVDAARWSVDPLAGITRDGFVYGRGALSSLAPRP